MEARSAIATATTLELNHNLIPEAQRATTPHFAGWRALRRFAGQGKLRRAGDRRDHPHVTASSQRIARW
ncbi:MULTISPECIES: hypothetical protein [unclassified Xanthobacter]|uniref:hypothetical protein n=1 Tax=unclassified Xanthobacter TaxID=2623496 RepID=UPI001EDF4212|nr:MULTISPECIES: hypothetical protein [unclassified Xanthobacter]